MSLRVDAYIREGDGVTHRISNAKDGDWIGVVITINNTTEFDITAFDTAAAGKLAGIFEHAAIEFRDFVARMERQTVVKRELISVRGAPSTANIDLKTVGPHREPTP